MALTYSSEVKRGSAAPAFSLPGVDGRTHSLDEYRRDESVKALVVIFMCNHCPYVIAVQDRINDLAREYGPKGVRVVGINPNDAERYPDDSFDAMKKRASEQGYVFDYLQDESQEAARAYNAVCTPDPYVYSRENGEFVLRYHGRIDDSWKEPEKVTRRELAEALNAILAGREPDADQKPAMGCSIKWKQ